MNLLRIWGGGIYETDDFYDVCDERGVMVWQDFLFACAAYAEDAETVAEITAEVRENVTRLSSHASLVIYNGSNENVWGWWDWGWQQALAAAGLTDWGQKYYEEVLPEILAELDPTRPYTPSSPFSTHPYEDDVYPNDPAVGTVHEWEVWNQVDYTHYADAAPRFCSEFGFQGPATWATMLANLPAEGFDKTSTCGSRTRRRTAATTSCSPGTCRTCPTATTSRRGTGSPLLTRRARSSSASRTTARGGRTPPARSSGSSTTAGPSPRGRPSTARSD